MDAEAPPAAEPTRGPQQPPDPLVQLVVLAWSPRATILASAPGPPDPARDGEHFYRPATSAAASWDYEAPPEPTRNPPAEHPGIGAAHWSPRQSASCGRRRRLLWPVEPHWSPDRSRSAARATPAGGPELTPTANQTLLWNTPLGRMHRHAMTCWAWCSHATRGRLHQRPYAPSPFFAPPSLPSSATSMPPYPHPSTRPIPSAVSSPSSPRHSRPARTGPSAW
mmetsp:Transcript_120432/g.275874  ORF Transcript_120432/g.275874 Transcript_120432/m.275874 type:complete len:223 (-) Transcript_120432:142-810(-)